MAHHLCESERRQVFLLPADMMDWLPEGDIVHLTIDAVAMIVKQRAKLSRFQG
jgi:hypothetical protein